MVVVLLAFRFIADNNDMSHRIAIENANTGRARIKTLESQMSGDRSTIAQLNAKLELLQADLDGTICLKVVIVLVH